MIVAKRDGKSWFSRRKADRWPLPKIDEIFDSVQGDAYIRTIHLLFRFWKVCTTDSCRVNIILTCKFWRFQFGVRHSKLTNASSLLQWMKNQVVRDMEYLRCYLDDSVVFSVNLNEHLERISQVFLAIGRHGLKVKVPKCFFAQAML